jgi:hypothetical protein
MQIRPRDVELMRHVARHRFLRSTNLVGLLGASAQQILRRLQLLFHHGYLDRPRAQLAYFQRGGSQALVYGLANKGAELLAGEDGLPRSKVDWAAKNRTAQHLYLLHTLAVADAMVAIELACRRNTGIRLIREEDLAAGMRQRDPFRWTVRVGAHRLGVRPDRVFGLEQDRPSGRAFFFLEADRATMPVVRPKLDQSSFYRKLLAYEATWTQGLHRSRFGFHRFRVLTVTSSLKRTESLLAACRTLPRGHGLFLFTDRHSLAQSDPLSHRWQTVRDGETATLL